MSVFTNDERLGKLCDKINSLEVKDRKTKLYRKSQLLKSNTLNINVYLIL